MCIRDRTLDDLKVMAKKATNPPYYYGFGFPATLEDEGPMKFFANLYSLGGQILNQDNTRAAFNSPCLLYTSDAADDLHCVDLGSRRII